MIDFKLYPDKPRISMDKFDSYIHPEISLSVDNIWHIYTQED